MSTPIEWVASEAELCGMRFEAELCARWWLLGYHVGRQVEANRSLLTDEAALRREVRVILGGEVGTRPPLSERPVR